MLSLEEFMESSAPNVDDQRAIARFLDELGLPKDVETSF